MTLLASPSVQSDSNEYRKHAKALGRAFSRWSSGSASTRPSLKEAAQTEELAKGGDADMRELAERRAARARSSGATR